jgi:uncharacterized UBP type Zn finger protein
MTMFNSTDYCIKCFGDMEDDNKQSKCKDCGYLFSARELTVHPEMVQMAYIGRHLKRIADALEMDSLPQSPPSSAEDETKDSDSSVDLTDF